MRRKRMTGKNVITVVAKTDGRGQIRPFGTYKGTSKKTGSINQTGALVRIGDKDYKVTSSGRVNIPKKIMEKYGTKGDDGRNRIEIKFATKRTVGGDHTQKVHTKIFRPLDTNKNFEQGYRPKNLSYDQKDVLNCDTPYDSDSDEDEYSFS